MDEVKNYYWEQQSAINKNTKCFVWVINRSLSTSVWASDVALWWNGHNWTTVRHEAKLFLSQKMAMNEIRLRHLPYPGEGIRVDTIDIDEKVWEHRMKLGANAVE